MSLNKCGTSPRRSARLVSLLFSRICLVPCYATKLFFFSVFIQTLSRKKNENSGLSGKLPNLCAMCFNSISKAAIRFNSRLFGLSKAKIAPVCVLVLATFSKKKKKSRIAAVLADHRRSLLKQQKTKNTSLKN